jgi:hypothetical protein
MVYRATIDFVSKVTKSRSIIYEKLGALSSHWVSVSRCACVRAWRKGSVNEWVPARGTPSRGGVTSIVTPLLSSKRRPHIKTRKSLGTNTDIAMGPNGTRNRDWLCWREPPTIYLTDRLFFHTIFIITINSPHRSIIVSTKRATARERKDTDLIQ